MMMGPTLCFLQELLARSSPWPFHLVSISRRPLRSHWAGVRIGIKDIYDIKGLRTSNGNRAWYWLYPHSDNTATPVQKLIDASAIIVGSVRGPSQVQGLYGNRPSHGLVILEHKMPMAPLLDTAGLIARDPRIWRDVAQAMYGSNITASTTYPTSIKTLTWPANTLLIDFLANVTAFLNANATAYNVTSSWSTRQFISPPTRNNDEPHLRDPNHQATSSASSGALSRRLRLETRRPHAVHQPRVSRPLGLGRQSNRNAGGRHCEQNEVHGLGKLDVPRSFRRDVFGELGDVCGFHWADKLSQCVS
ncbi:amidase signature enzyme [Macroventuria anomochaeta]|uniref:Amidase signature enzyme n=1 Tax=Macroventuria anomochaeta TaxID=301207 RepID=A0ACB6S365_9PLEO|nr:amidase signature enzyme [Macroventuria anomochaeta]KAF2628606.1 amidase signature enzyme [Macroventuria anomochaeta]